MTQPDPDLLAAPPRPGRSPSPQVRIGGFYLTLFTVAGVFTAYSGIWLDLQGLTETQIGIVSATPVAVIVGLNLWIGRLADRAPDWQQAIALLAAVAALGPFGLMAGGGFWPILLSWSLCSVAQGLMVPVSDAAAIRMARREGFDFPALRAFGTIGYLVAIFATGWLVTAFGPAAYVPALAAAALLRAGAALALPRFRAPPGLAAAGGARRLSEVMRPWFLLPLLGWSLVSGTHSVLNTFQALHWKTQGLGELWITLLIAVGAVTETIMFVTFRHLALRFRARHLILASALLAVVRWTAFAFEPGLPWLIPLQAMHALTYAMGFMGCVAFIANWTSEDIAAEAQSFFTVTQFVATVAALVGFGWLAQRFGSHAYFATAAAALIGAGMIRLSLRLKEPAR